MGFALWIDGDVACATGTHEYRPMGVAVIARTGVFSPLDFRPVPRTPPRSSQSFRGLFASLGDLNRFLVKTRSQQLKKNLRKSIRRLESIV
jgi:hypothetical protein